MMSLAVYDTPSMDNLLADFTGRAEGVKFGTNRHGFSVLTVDRAPMPLAEAFEVYEWPGTPHVVVSDNATETVWEGRLEDINIIAGGVSLVALGYQRALSDVPYTALWSKSGSGGWRAVTAEELGSRTPDRYEMDNNNRVYIAPRKGEAFGNNNHSGTMAYLLPHRGLRSAARFLASYDLLLPSGWQVRIAYATEGFSGFSVVQTITATGSAQSGSIDVAVGGDIVIVDVRNASGSQSAITDDTGVNYVRLTALRIKSESGATPVTASGIATALVAHVNGTNSGQLSASAAEIQTTAVDLYDEIYEDEFPDEILDRLALLHSYEWGVWEDRRLAFRPNSGQGLAWYVDVTEILDLQRSLDNVRNSAYGVYRDAGGRTLRTGTIGIGDSQARYGVLRRGFVQVQTSSSTEANYYRGAWLNDRAYHQARARIVFTRLYDATGTQWPLWSCRAGDSITMRNLPPTLSTEIDQIRTFMVDETDFDADRDELSVSPLEPTPSLVTLVARRGGPRR